MNKKISLGICLSLVIVSITATFAITMVYSRSLYSKIINNISSRSQSYDTAEEISSFISTYFYGSLDNYNNNLGASVAEGYVNGLGDPNSYYMTASEYSDYVTRRDNGITGVGIETAYNYDINKFVVVYVYNGSPAYNEGIEAGDFISAVNNETVRRDNYRKLNDLFFGTKLQTVTIEYNRDDTTKTVQLMLGFNIPSVTSKTMGDLGYVRISRFYKNTAEELEKVLEDMKANGIESIIFDVRNTTDGTIKYAANAIDSITGNISGNIAVAKKKNGDTEVFAAHNSKVSFNYVVLINGNTSGAAELFACDLRDISFAQLIGTTTAGNGTMQEVFSLSDGSAIMLTTALVIPKNGDSAVYDKIGVAPTKEVTLIGNDSELLLLDENQDNQLTEAVNLINQMGM